MEITESIHIQASPSVVWNVLTRLDEWETWNDVCADCVLDTGEELEHGTCFSFTLRPYYFPMRISPRVVSCEPGKEIVWAGSRLGVSAVHSFQLVPEDGGIRLVSREEFRGLMFHFSRLIGVPGRLHRLTRRMMNAIRDRSECTCAAGDNN